MDAQTSTFSALSHSMDDYIQRWMEHMHATGMAVALLDRERIQRLSVYGRADRTSGAPVTPDSLFEIGSITKTFTAVAILQAVESGLVDLRAPVTTYLPWFQVQTAHPPITIHHLLNHSAGLIGIIDQSPDMRSAAWLLRETQTAWPPGERFHYSDAGYQLLALVLEAVTAQPFCQVIQTKIFDPLGMTKSYPAQVHALRPQMALGYTSLYDDRPAHHSHPLVEAPWMELHSGDAGIVTTAGDLARFAQMLLNGGQGPRGRLLAESSIELMTRETVAVHGNDLQYGYGLEIRAGEGIINIGHGGGMPGYSARIAVEPQHGIGVVMLGSKPSANSVTWKLLHLWRAANLGQSLDQIDQAISDPAHIENAAEYAGNYRCGNRILQLAAEDNRLVLLAAGERVTLEKRDEDAFYVPHPDFDLFLLRFGRAPGAEDGEGPVVEAFHSADWYVSDRYQDLRTFDVPPEWLAYPGHYRAHNPFQPNFRVILRKGGLFLVYPSGDEEQLVPLPDGSFQVGESPSPERIRFSQVFQGQAHCATLSAVPYYRFFTP